MRTKRRAKVKHFYLRPIRLVLVSEGEVAGGGIRDDKSFVVKLCHVGGNQQRDGMQEEIFLETAKPIGAFQSVETSAG